MLEKLISNENLFPGGVLESARVSFLQNSIIILFKKKIFRKSLALWIFLAKIAEKFALKVVMQIQKALLNDHLRVSKVS